MSDPKRTRTHEGNDDVAESYGIVSKCWRGRRSNDHVAAKYLNHPNRIYGENVHNCGGTAQCSLNWSELESSAVDLRRAYFCDWLKRRTIQLSLTEHSVMSSSMLSIRHSYDSNSTHGAIVEVLVFFSSNSLHPQRWYGTFFRYWISHYKWTSGVAPPSRDPNLDIRLTTLLQPTQPQLSSASTKSVEKDDK